jgi:hypothetical protein
MVTNPIHSLIKPAQENLEEKWKNLLAYEEDDGCNPIPEHYHQDAIRLFENIHQMLQTYTTSRYSVYPSLLRKVMPFFRRNYRDFIEKEVETIDILPLYASKDIFKRFKIFTVTGDSEIGDGHNYHDNEVALIKVNGTFYLF